MINVFEESLIIFYLSVGTRFRKVFNAQSALEFFHSGFEHSAILDRFCIYKQKL